MEAWVSEATGQSYKAERTEGEQKKQLFYVKLLPREISEKRGFEELFMQNVGSRTDRRTWNMATPKVWSDEVETLAGLRLAFWKSL